MFPKDYEVLQNRALTTGDVCLCERVARFYPKADVEALQAKVIESGRPHDWLSFAQNVDQANIGKIQNHVINHGFPMDCYLFARDVHKPGVDIELLQARVARDGMGEVRRFFASNIPGADSLILRATREPKTAEESLSVTPGF